jgi:uncharacterized protein YggT (Ycf19 family)
MLISTSCIVVGGGGRVVGAVVVVVVVVVIVVALAWWRDPDHEPIQIIDQLGYPSVSLLHYIGH